MGGDFAFLDIIFFAMVAGFLILRLRSVLGRRTGNENPNRWRPQPPPKTEPGAEPRPLPDNVAKFPTRDSAAPADPAPAATPLEAGLTQIKLADSAFDPKGFVGGARAAFEMIVGAFAQGDTAALRPLLSDEVYDQFATAIRERQQAKRTLTTTLVGISAAEIVEARMEARTAMVTVKFVSEQVNVTKDEGGAVVEGDPSQVATITDVWTFSRNTRSRDPNWHLVATSAQH